MKYSEEQQQVFEHFLKSNKHLCIEATAGSGKTTVLLQCAKLTNITKKTIFLAYNNTIVDELKSKLPSYIRCNTLHSIGFKLLIDVLGSNVKVDENKYFKLALKEFYSIEGKKVESKDFRECFLIQSICNLVRLTLTKEDYNLVTELCCKYNIEYTEEIIMKVLSLLDKNKKKSNTIDFTDMIYLPYILNLIKPIYDIIFLDESQDLNNLQKQLVLKMLKVGGRLIAVGDSNQSIYSFTGSSIYSFKELQQRENTLTLKLSTTYRCPNLIVNEARRVNNEIVCGIERDGEVNNGEWIEIQDDNLVLCRTTKPLINLFFKLVDQGKKVSVIGKEIENGLLQLAEKVQHPSKEVTVKRCLQEQLRVKEDLLKYNVKQYKKHPSYIAITEKVEVLGIILNKLQSSLQLSQTIKEIFNEKHDGIKLMTIHRSKGLENDNVFLVQSYEGENLLPFKYAKQDWELQQERNLEFVALTRSKNKLTFIHI